MTPAIAGFAAQAGNPLTVVAVGTSFPGRLKLPQAAEGAAEEAAAGEQRRGHDARGGCARSTTRCTSRSWFRTRSRRARSSRRSRGVRVFKPLKNQHEVVLTFNVAADLEYWQIEECTWTAAPILQNPSSRFADKHGRKYQVFTSGGEIQTIALVTPQAAYWV